MTKVTWLKIVNPLLFVSFLVQALSGVFSRLIPYEVFEPVHTINGYLLIVLVTLHIYLNWDWVRRVLTELGGSIRLWRVRMKPGSPLVFATLEGRLVFGLPGNPVSCAVCFLLFARTVLEGLQGLPVARPPHIAGSLEADLPTNGERPMYQPAEWSVGANGEVRVSPLTWRGSGDPFGMSVANALVYRPADAPAAPRGETASFIPLDLPR